MFPFHVPCHVCLQIAVINIYIQVAPPSTLPATCESAGERLRLKRCLPFCGGRGLIPLFANFAGTVCVAMRIEGGLRIRWDVFIMGPCVWTGMFPCIKDLMEESPLECTAFTYLL